VISCQAIVAPFGHELFENSPLLFKTAGGCVLMADLPSSLHHLHLLTTCHDCSESDSWTVCCCLTSHSGDGRVVCPTLHKDSVSKEFRTFYLMLLLFFRMEIGWAIFPSLWGRREQHCWPNTYGDKSPWNGTTVISGTNRTFVRRLAISSEHLLGTLRKGGLDPSKRTMASRCLSTREVEAEPAKERVS
jgi:hypothetical protein